MTKSELAHVAVLIDLIKEIGFPHPLVAKRLKEMKSMKEFKEDKNFDKMIEALKKAGLW